MLSSFWNIQSFWIALGLILLIAEVASGTFFILFFGISALLTGIFVLLGLENVTAQILVFAVMSLLSLVLFRRRVVRAMGVASDFKNDSGEMVMIEREILPDEVFEVTYQGTVWQAVNQSQRVLKKKEYVKIARVEGVKLIIQ